MMALGRWMSQDPIEYQAGDVNLYWYQRNTPIYYLDPLEEQKK